MGFKSPPRVIAVLTINHSLSVRSPFGLVKHINASLDLSQLGIGGNQPFGTHRKIDLNPHVLAMPFDSQHHSVAKLGVADALSQLVAPVLSGRPKGPRRLNRFSGLGPWPYILYQV